MRKRLAPICVLLAALLLLTGCFEKTDPAAAAEASAVPTAEPTVVLTPDQQSVAISAVVEDTPTPVPTPTPSPTPEPTEVPPPTEIPFSYYAPTVNMSFEELIGGLEDTYYEAEGGDAVWPKGYPSSDTYYIIVDEYWQVVMVYTKDASGAYTVPVRYMLCSTGSSKLGPTKKGVFSMKETRVRFGTFAGGDYCAQYWTLIVSRTYFHSVLYTKKDLSTLILQSYKDLGTRVSHGCIRLTVPDARWIWYNCAYETQVEIRTGSKNDEATKAIREQLKLAEAPTSSFTLKPGESPYTDNWTIEDVALAIEFVNATPPPVPKS